MNAEALCGQDAPCVGSLGACPATRINIALPLGLFLAPRTPPSVLKPRSPQAGAFPHLNDQGSLFLQQPTNVLLDCDPEEAVTLASLHFLIDCSAKSLQ